MNLNRSGMDQEWTWTGSGSGPELDNYYIAQVHATLVILAQKGLMSTDELRRAMEALPGHKEMTYYHRLRYYNPKL